MLFTLLAVRASAQTPDEAALRQKLQNEPRKPDNYFALAKLLEDQARYRDAEIVLLQAREAIPAERDTHAQLASFYTRVGEFDRAIAVLEQVVARYPDNPDYPYVIATYYWDKAYRDPLLSPAEKQVLVAKGLAATDAALKIKPDHVESLVYKNLLLRLQAMAEKDATRQQRLLAEADALRERAMAIMKSGKQTKTTPPVAPELKLPPADQDFGMDVAFVIVNTALLRKAPDAQGATVRTMEAGDALVMVTRDPTAGFYNVVDADTSDEGWIRADQVTVRLTKQPKTSPFEATKTNETTQNPTVSVKNDTDLEITLTMGEVKYRIAPRDTLSITIAPGLHKYIASAPGVLPFVGTDTLQAGYKYSWQFYIQRKMP